MTKPATDDLLERLLLQTEGLQDEAPTTMTIGHLRSFIARIKSEREQTIRECINAIAAHPGGEFDDQGLDTAVTVLDGLQEPKP